MWLSLWTHKKPFFHIHIFWPQKIWVNCYFLCKKKRENKVYLTDQKCLTEKIGYLFPSGYTENRGKKGSRHLVKLLPKRMCVCTKRERKTYYIKTDKCKFIGLPTTLFLQRMSNKYCANFSSKFLRAELSKTPHDTRHNVPKCLTCFIRVIFN